MEPFGERLVFISRWDGEECCLDQRGPHEGSFGNEPAGRSERLQRRNDSSNGNSVVDEIDVGSYGEIPRGHPLLFPKLL